MSRDPRLYFNEELVLDVIRNKVPPLLQALRDFLDLA